MKVIDKTPFLNEKGTFGLWQRFESMLEYGSAWRAEVEAQGPVIAQLERVLEKGFTLIRNLNLENSKIIEPLILVGPPGVHVIYVTPEAGFFEAKGDEWNVIQNDNRRPAKLNMLTRVGRLARAVQVFLNRQGVYLPGMVEPVLIAGNPGVHIEALRPVVRVVLSDAVKQWAASLLQSPPVLRSEAVREVVEHLLNPHKKAAPAQLQPAEIPGPGVVPEPPPGFTPIPTAPGEAPQRARAIFRAAEESKPFDPADLSFEFDEHGQTDLPEARSGTAAQRAAPAARIGAFTGRQWMLLVIMAIVEFVVLGGFVYLLLFGNQ